MFNAQARWDRPLPQDEAQSETPAAVVASFKQGKFFPLWFFLHDCKHVVKNIHFSWQEHKGQDTWYFFSLTNTQNTRFTVCFKHQSMSWRVCGHYE